MGAHGSRSSIAPRAADTWPRMRAILFSLLVTIVLAAAAGFVGVLAGRTLADAPGEYERGVDDGERLGRAQARAAFKAGNADYDAAVETARGSAGYAEGRREGATIGAERGAAQGPGSPRSPASTGTSAAGTS